MLIQSLFYYTVILSVSPGVPLSVFGSRIPHSCPHALCSPFSCVASPMGDGQDKNPLLWIFLGDFVPLCSQERVQRNPVRLEIMHWNTTSIVLQSCCHWGVFCHLSPMVCYVWNMDENATANCFPAVCCKTPHRHELRRRGAPQVHWLIFHF